MEGKEEDGLHRRSGEGGWMEWGGKERGGCGEKEEEGRMERQTSGGTGVGTK